MVGINAAYSVLTTLGDDLVSGYVDRMSTRRPKIAFVSVGGTIASLGSGPFDLLDYNASDVRVGAAEIVEQTGVGLDVADVVPIDFRCIDSTAITAQDWAELADLCRAIAGEAGIDGIVVGHGTASLEETAWALALVLDLPVGVVLTGSMRPLTGLSSDAAANLAGAIRVAAAAPAGAVLVALNGEVHDPRTVTKRHTLRLTAFQSPWYGPVGTVDGLDVRLVSANRRLPVFSGDLLRAMPRCDIVYSHVGADGIAIRALVDAGARGI